VLFANQFEGCARAPGGARRYPPDRRSCHEATRLGRAFKRAAAISQQMPEKYGEFFPFAAAMSATGEISSVAGDIGNEHPDSQKMIDFLAGVFQNQAGAGEIKASGICIDARVIPPGQSKKTDAILARLEHRDGEAVDAYLPYRKTLLRKVKYGDLFASEGTPQVFVGASG
jgi:hypothetical protein